MSTEQVLLTTAQSVEKMNNYLMILLGLFIVLALSAVIFTVVTIKTRRFSVIVLIFIYLAALATMACCFYCNGIYQNAIKVMDAPINQIVPPTTEATEFITETTLLTEVTDVPTEPVIEETEPTTEPIPILSPYKTENSDPANWNIRWTISPADGSETYTRETEISFGDPEEYYPMPGVTTFRGNNYRTGSTYGNVDITDQTLEIKWSNIVGSLNGWSGIGWTGQPLLVQWDDETRQLLGLYDSKKDKDGLIEVIATTLDGYVYFYDLEDGSKTRDPLWIGMSVKGTATLDPRGIPLLYVGAGLTNDSNGAAPKMFVISLIENKVLYSQTTYDNWADRSWCALDSSPQVSGEADTLFWPCENGIIYSIKLNTQYDPAAKILTVDPQTEVKVKYSSKHNHTLGFESSIVIVGQYAFLGDNGGMFFCVDLNTMELVWAQDIHDDLNATPVFEWGEDNQGYLYLGTSMEYANGTSYLYKLNATTGEIVWEYTYSGIIYDYDVSGGVLSSPVLGKPGTSLDGQIIFAVAKTHGYTGGTLVSLDKESGEVIWEKKMDNYAWSSPTAIYGNDGTGYLIFGDSAGRVYIIDDGGNTKTYISLGSVIESSPVVFDDMFVIAARSGYVYGIKIS